MIRLSLSALASLIALATSAGRPWPTSTASRTSGAWCISPTSQRGPALQARAQEDGERRAGVHRRRARGATLHAVAGRTSCATRASSRPPARPTGWTARMVHAVITAESGYNAGAVSKAGARGLMQLMPRRPPATACTTSTTRAIENIQRRRALPARLITMFNGNLELRRGRLQRRRERRHPLRQQDPSYAETVHTCRRSSASTASSSARASGRSRIIGHRRWPRGWPAVPESLPEP